MAQTRSFPARIDAAAIPRAAGALGAGGAWLVRHRVSVVLGLLAGGAVAALLHQSWGGLAVSGCLAVLFASLAYRRMYAGRPRVRTASRTLDPHVLEHAGPARVQAAVRNGDGIPVYRARLQLALAGPASFHPVNDWPTCWVSTDARGEVAVPWWQRPDASGEGRALRVKVRCVDRRVRRIRIEPSL